MRRNSNLLSIGSLAVATVAFGFYFLAPAPSRANDDDRPVTSEENRRISAALTDQGYSDVHDIEVDDGRFEVDARNPDGHKVDLELDLTSLEILHEDRD